MVIVIKMKRQKCHIFTSMNEWNEFTFKLKLNRVVFATVVHDHINAAIFMTMNAWNEFTFKLNMVVFVTVVPNYYRY